MKTLLGIGGGLVVLGLVVALSLAGWTFSVLNRDTRLRNQITAQTTANQITFDTTWKTIQQLNADT